MNKNGEIIIIEDDLDDQWILTECFRELDLPNEIKFFADGFSAFEYLNNSNEQPFLILSDVNLPKVNGFELRDKIIYNERIRIKCIPFLFFSTSIHEKYIGDAYSRSVQGFFKKPNSYQESLRVMRNIIEYWKDCYAPECAADLLT